MDMVTITDHDTIDGGLEIAHLPFVFLSEEITATFPEDGTDVHVVALDINAAQHKEIQRLRGNIYELVDYLRDARIPHFAAHPLSGPNDPFKPEHVQKLILLFTHLEGCNGTREKASSDALCRILSGMTHSDIDEWAARHRIEPCRRDPQRFLTGGSDDHAGLSAARAYTIFPDAHATRASLRDAFFKGAIEIGGAPGTGELLGHSIYSVTMGYFQHSKSKSAFNALWEEGDGKSNAPAGSGVNRQRRIVGIIEDSLRRAQSLSLEHLVVKSHTDAAQVTLGTLGRTILREVTRAFTDDLVTASEKVDLEGAFDAIPGLLSAASMALPYLFGYRYTVRDREAADRLAGSLGFDNDAETDCKVAIFTDTGLDINGVALGLNRLVRAMRQQGADVRLVICTSEIPKQNPELLDIDDGLTVMPALREIPLPIYNELKLGIPSLIDVMDYLSRERIKVVQVSTPGPLGLIAALAAKLCGLPIVANYHTALPQYAVRLTGDASFGALVKSLVAAFYRMADHVIVPSQAVIETLVAFGVQKDRIALLQRGVETERFRPSKANPHTWGRFGLNGSPKLIYVGRVSREKGLDTLLDAFGEMRHCGVDADLVIVGDGPYKEALSERTDDPNVIFVGYRTGEELSQLFASADVFVFPSATDTFGNAVLEAQASGLPSVVVDRGGPAEQVTPDVHGLVVPAGDAGAMAEGMARLVLDKELRKEMGGIARRRALAHTAAKAAKAHFQFYLSVWKPTSNTNVLSFPHISDRPSHYQRAAQ